MNVPALLVIRHLSLVTLNFFMMPLLFLEFLGTTELLVIALVALIVFGPRKLPELGRSLGKSLGEFKRASDDFKRTWEREVEVERIEREVHIEREVTAALVNDDITSVPSETAAIAGAPDGGQFYEPEPIPETEQTIARTPAASSAAAVSQPAPDASEARRRI